MKWQDRPRSSNIEDIRNYNQFELFLFDSKNELAGIGRDLVSAITGPFRGDDQYMVVPTNYQSSYTPTPVSDAQMAAFREARGLPAPEGGMTPQARQIALHESMSQPRNPK